MAPQGCAEPERKRWMVGGFAVVLTAQLVFVLVTLFGQFKTEVLTEFCWVGGVTSANATFRTRGPLDSTRSFVVSSSADLSDAGAAFYSTTPVAYTSTATAKVPVKAVDVTGLAPATKYYYGQLEGSAVRSSGSFSTPPVEGTGFNFRVATAGCALTGSNAPVFEKIKDTDPFLFLHGGDIHYLDPNDDTLDERLDGYARVWGSPRQRELFQSTAFAYMWDDHCYCANNLDSDCPGRLAARQGLQMAIPHYPLPAVDAVGAPAPNADGLSDVSPYQSFTIGTVRFIITDLRSEARSSTESYAGSIYSAEQKAWLYNELSLAGNYDFVVWLTSKPWIGEEDVGGDNWQGFAKDRQELSDHIASTVGSDKGNLLVVSSDAHMVAFDDGSNTEYTTAGVTQSAGFPILQSGPLHNIGSTKGGPFSEGCFTTTMEMNNQFSTIDFDVTTNPANPCVTVASYRVEGSAEPTEILKKTMCGNIFAAQGAEDADSSCSAPYFSDATIGLVSSAVVVVVAVSASAAFMAGKEERTTVAKYLGLALLAMGTTMVIGIGLPLIVYTSTGFFAFYTTAMFGFMLAIALVFAISMGLKVRAIKGADSEAKVSTQA